MPHFHGRIFTLEQYMDWYVAENGAFTYFQDWSGFNVPSTAFQPFYEGKFDPLTRKEERLLGLFGNLQGRFYVIGIFDGGKKGTLTHELAHALFFIDDDYRQAVREAMRGYDTSALERQLAKEGYARHVIPDEVQAYIGRLPASWARLRESLPRCAESCGRYSGSMRRGWRCRMSTKFIGYIGDSLLLLEIVAMPDRVGGAEVARGSGKL